MNELLKPAGDPELVFGIVAPIGVDVEFIDTALSDALKEMGYGVRPFKVTELMTEVREDQSLTSGSSIAAYKDRIAYANAVRRRLGKDSLAALAISAIRTFRGEQWRRKSPQKFYDESQLLTEAEETPLPAMAYIIRQLKRPEEVELLRRVYGRQFILVSGYATAKQRQRRISSREQDSGASKATADEAALALIVQDSNETQDDHGQKVRDAFPQGDVFVDASDKEKARAAITRFVKLFFGNNQITPSHDEYAMFIAKSASLRSADLSRQVGAAIFAPTGEVVTLGCNEVPRAGGGTYWEEDSDDARDFRRGFDPNEKQKDALFVDLIQRLKAAGCFSEPLAAIDDLDVLAQEILKLPGVADARAMDLIEFGRIVHAEMSALNDASRNGHAVRGATLFCTTFPCHLCASNIVASGLARVVYIEPYPKSYAEVLHDDAIQLEREDDGDELALKTDENEADKVAKAATVGSENRKVIFEPFVGVAPRRYRDLFEKGKRKQAGMAQEWERGRPEPRINVLFPSYFEAEAVVLTDLRSRLEPLALPSPEPVSEPSAK
jgi:deoxycytidylate deaminase